METATQPLEQERNMQQAHLSTAASSFSTLHPGPIGSRKHLFYTAVPDWLAWPVSQAVLN